MTAIETEEGRRWAESRIKALTGGDPIAARFMRQDFFEFTPQFKLIIAGNHKPGLRSVDEAIRRRFNLIPFTVTIPPEERDDTLGEKLQAELPGILAWMIEGCTIWQKQGLNPPRVVTDATAAYLESEDAIAAWIEDCCERADHVHHTRMPFQELVGLGHQQRRARRQHQALRRCAGKSVASHRSPATTAVGSKTSSSSRRWRRNEQETLAI